MYASRHRAVGATAALTLTTKREAAFGELRRRSHLGLGRRTPAADIECFVCGDLLRRRHRGATIMLVSPSRGDQHTMCAAKRLWPSCLARMFCSKYTREPQANDSPLRAEGADRTVVRPYANRNKVAASSSMLYIMYSRSRESKMGTNTSAGKTTRLRLQRSVDGPRLATGQGSDSQAQTSRCNEAGRLCLWSNNVYGRLVVV